MKKIIVLFAVILSVGVLNIYGQKNEFQFGKISQAEITSTSCPIDSTADAYVICNVGSTQFVYDDTKGYFCIIFKRYVRVKILKKSAFENATVLIPLYKNTYGEERVDGLKGNTYNLENGKTVISKLEKTAFFKEEVSKNWDQMRFTMPNVKEGSVIEYKFEIQSDFNTIESWNFQQLIPVIYTQYEVSIPEYFNYKVFQNGYEKLKLVKESKLDYLTMTWKERSNGLVSTTNYGSQNINYQNYVTTYTGENIKAFHEEPFMKSMKNYITSVEFELQSTHYPNSMVKYYSKDWNSITEELKNDDDFGGILKRKGATDELVQKATAGITQPMAKAEAIYTFIRNQFKWNGTKQKWASKSIHKTMDEKSGNAADINLLLVAALRNAGFKSDPVVLSTRDNGMILTAYPMIRKLNYVIACVVVDGQKYLLDATDKKAPFGFLPQRCLNGQGRIVQDESSEDIDLDCKQTYFKYISGTFSLTETGDIKGTWNEYLKGYAAHDFRADIANSKNQDEFIKDYQKQEPELTIIKYQFDNLDTLNSEVRINYDVQLTGQTETTGNLLMIHPLLIEQMKENLYKPEERKFPVDYSYCYYMIFTAFFDIPQGYAIETLPKPVILALPNKDASYTFNVAVTNNKIQILRKFAINKSMFLPDEYLNLKEFYNQMVAKEAEVIVLKKI